MSEAVVYVQTNNNKNYKGLAKLIENRESWNFISSNIQTSDDAMFLVMLHKLTDFISSNHPESDTSFNINMIDKVLRNSEYRMSLVNAFNIWRFSDHSLGK